MLDKIEVVDLKVARLRRALCKLLRDKATVVVRKNSRVCAVLLTLSGPFYSWSGVSAVEKRHLRAALDAVLEYLAR